MRGLVDANIKCRFLVGFFLLIVLISGCISESTGPQPTQPVPAQTSNVLETPAVAPTVTQISTVTPTGNQTSSPPPSIP